MIASLAILFAATQSQGEPTTLGCSLVTAANQPVAFDVTGPAASRMLVPLAGSVWPNVPVASSGMQEKGREQVLALGGPKEGPSLRLVQIGADRSLATLFVRAKDGTDLPAAVGFCRTAASKAEGVQSAVPGPVDIRPLDPASWKTNCALVSPDGRSARLDYQPFDNGRATFVGLDSWPWTAKMSASRGARSVNTARVGITKLGGKGGLAATEYAYFGRDEAAHIVLFDKLAAANGQDTPAAAICGYGGITRAPRYQ